MATRLLRFAVLVEDKGEWAGGAGHLPDAQEVAPHMQDILSDSTRGEWTLPWRVTEVRAAS